MRGIGTGFSLQFPRFSWRAGAFFLRHWWSWRKHYKSSILLNFGEPVMMLIALGWGLGAYVTRIDDRSFLEFVAPALMAVTAMHAVVFDTTFGGWNRLREQGVYDAAISTSMTERDLVAGDMLWESIRSMLYGLIFLAVLLAFGLVESGWVVLLPIVLLLNGFLFTGISLMVVSTVKEFEHLFYFFTLLITPMFMFSGVFFPVERLPESLGFLVRALPLYHTVEIMRDLILDRLSISTLFHFAWLGGTTLLVMLFPVAFLRRALSK